MVDDITRDEVFFLEGVSDTSSGDLEWKKRLVSSAWVGDGITDAEQQFFYHLMATGERWPEVARALASFPTLIADAPATLRTHAVASVSAIQDRDHLLLLTRAAWYADGLSPAEAAFITAIRTIAHQYPDLFQPLVDDFHAQSTTVTLPLAGEVTIWVFQNTPFPADERLLERIAAAAAAGETFLQTPFPTDHIILLVTDPAEPGFETGGWHFSTHMLLPRRDGEVPNVAHETAHYFFAGGPFWLQEGAANFLEYHVIAEEDPVARRAFVERKADSCLANSGFENIRHRVLREGVAAGSRICEYFLGERFLFRVSDVMGQASLGAALRELFPTESLPPRLEEAGIDEEEHVYRTLAKHVPEEREAEFNAVYREFHGGFDGFEEPGEPDDHGNTPASTTPLAVEERVEGVLDYPFDEDFFSIPLDGEVKYEVIFEHAITTSSLGLFAVRGDLIVRFESGAGLTDRLVTPPASTVYYLAVQNFGGEAAPYALLVREVPLAEDDHGDFLTTATDIAIGETLTGVLHDGTDSDVFRFHLEANRLYEMDIIPPMGKVIRSWLYDGEGFAPEGWYGNSFTAAEEGYGDSIIFDTSHAGTHYLVVDGAQESDLEYRVTITVGEGNGLE